MRMLGDGRPFIVELINAKRTIVSQSALTELEVIFRDVLYVLHRYLFAQIMATLVVYTHK